MLSNHFDDFVQAIFHGDLAGVRYSIDEKGVKRKGLVYKKRNDNGLTTLHWADLSDTLKVMRLRIEEEGMDPSEGIGKFACTLLHVATMLGDLEMVKCLIEEGGVDFNVKMQGGITPLHLAAHYGKLEVVRYLINKGANANATTENMKTPRDVAEGCRVECALWIAEQSCRVKGALWIAEHRGNLILSIVIASAVITTMALYIFTTPGAVLSVLCGVGVGCVGYYVSDIVVKECYANTHNNPSHLT
ncbi:hypothetical protein BIY23_01240 [Wolbachia pipientis]|uniref:Uncharacterized protein n=1 Tax=Wolbachia pipientis TaxID=955 RepID=A0A1E7QLK1_WOLPI|nr:ankyrin repeat domain-containing protein [Wolbachia pipientis]OEY87094.1 hypothetical protein BIY23_01240 [Wolbachia pipientis]